MPCSLQAWYSRDDLEWLAANGKTVDGDVQLSKLTRLVDLVHTDRCGPIAITLAAEHAPDGRLLLKLALRGQLVVTCQRCLAPLAWSFDECPEWLVVDAESDAARLNTATQPLVLDDGRLGIEALLEDELIVALPMVPRHEAIDDCGPLAQNLGEPLSDAGLDRTVESR
jgi:uncharacterized protein